MNSSDHSGHKASRCPENDTGQAFRQTTPNVSTPNCSHQPPPASGSSALGWSVAGLAITPAAVSLAAWLAPHLPVRGPAQDLTSFLFAVTIVSGSLFALSRGRLALRGQLAVGGVAGLILAALAAYGVQTPAAVVLVGSALIALGHTFGHAVGSRIEHPGHLLPASVVAACVDIASVIHPKGLTHAVVASQRALDLLTLSVPVFGTHAYAPSIGVGDMVFGALVLGTASRHQISTARVAGLIALALLLAGLASALLQQAVPALPAIGLCVVLGVPQARRLRPRDRKTAIVFMIGAAMLAVAVVISRFIG